MTEPTDDQNDTPAPAEPTLSERVAALEKALATLGDHVCPGGVSTLEVWHEWRKSVG